VVATGNRVMTVLAVAVQGQDAWPALGGARPRQEQVDRQRRVALGQQQQFLAPMVVQVVGAHAYGFPLLRGGVRSKEGTQLGGKGGLPRATGLRGVALEAQRQRRLDGALPDAFVGRRPLCTFLARKPASRPEHEVSERTTKGPAAKYRLGALHPSFS